MFNVVLLHGVFAMIDRGQHDSQSSVESGQVFLSEQWVQGVTAGQVVQPEPHLPLKAFQRQMQRFANPVKVNQVE